MFEKVFQKAAVACDNQKTNFGAVSPVKLVSRFSFRKARSVSELPLAGGNCDHETRGCSLQTDLDNPSWDIISKSCEISRHVQSSTTSVSSAYSGEIGMMYLSSSSSGSDLSLTGRASTKLSLPDQSLQSRRISSPSECERSSKPRKLFHSTVLRSKSEATLTSLPQASSSHALVSNHILPGPAPLLKSKYVLKRELNRGNSGVVRLCVDKKTGERFACKTISKKILLDDEGRRDILREVEIMHKLSSHENVVCLKGAFEDAEAIHLVMDLCDAGDLSGKVPVRGQRSVSELEAAILFKQLTLAVQHMHGKGVLHRDLKPENILLTKSGNGEKVKLADFGVALELRPGEKTTGVKGTKVFFAPEMLTGSGHYGLEADVWSLGVVLFLFLTGELPFSGSTDLKLYQQISKGSYCFKRTIHGHSVSKQAQELVSMMLQVSPLQRCSINEILSHSWLRV